MEVFRKLKRRKLIKYETYYYRSIDLVKTRRMVPPLAQVVHLRQSYTPKRADFVVFGPKRNQKVHPGLGVPEPIELKLSEYVPYDVLLYISCGEQDPSTTARVMAPEGTAGRSKTRKIAGWRTLKPPFSPVE